MPHLEKRFLGFPPPARRKRFLWLGGVAIMWALAGCASIPDDQREPGDRFEAGNRAIYDFNEGLDRVALRPVSTAYIEHITQPVRASITRFYDNLTYLDTVLNGFLQGKGKQGVYDLARFAVNTTVGILGFFDVATPIGLPQHKEDFGQTLGKWGAGSGEYLVYPLIGPSSVRDTGGVAVSLLTNPLTYAVPPVAITLGILEVVDLRVRNEAFVRLRDAAALDPYVFTRESYLQHRQSEVYDGNPPRPKLELFDDPIPQPQTEEGAPAPDSLMRRDTP